jgi:anti-sigma B factor antagonist
MSGSGTDNVPRLHTVVEDAADRCTVTVTGELDVLTGPVLQRILDSVAGGVRHLRLDVAQLSFCDVAWLRALLRAQQVARERGIRLIVSNPPSHFEWLLRVTGTAGHLLGGVFTGDELAGDTGDHVQRTANGTTTAVSPLPSPATGPGTAEPESERDRRADERDRRADDRDLLDQERARLLDERAHRIREHQRWEDIREDLADIRERDLEQRHAADAESPRRDGPREP